MPVLPMFPLGSVLLPGMPLPLHVFEPRYRQLMADCLAGTPEFGVALIERGQEVGGDDVRTDLGTVARIVEAGQLEDGRWVLTALGTRRIRVRRWLPDDPYPRAEVEDVAEVVPDEPEPLGELDGQLRRVLALRAELGDPAPPATIELADDPLTATWQAAGVAGVGPLDLQDFLACPDHDARRARLAELLADQEELLRARIGP